MDDQKIPRALTYDDVLLVPRRSGVRSRRDVCMRVQLTRHIQIATPIISSNMDTVTEERMALALASAGGIGIIHRFLTIQAQVKMVEHVKSPHRLIVRDVHTIRPDRTVTEARRLMHRHHVTSLLVLDEQRKVLGILTSRDVLPVQDALQPISLLMATGDALITAPADTTYDEAVRLLHQHRVEKLPLVDEEGKLVGLLVMRDLLDELQHPESSRDASGRPLVGAAVGVVGDYRERAEALVAAGCDVLVVDVAHGHTEHTMAAVRTLKQAHSHVDLIAGNVATGVGTRDLIDAGADGVKVGVGPGAACTTRIVTGFGMPQFSAVLACAAAARPLGVPIIADGGIKAAGDMVKALAAGADTVMIGGLLAGTDESPGATIRKGGRTYKAYRGMASRAAAIDRLRRERDEEEEDFLESLTVVPEGVEATVPYRGAARDVLYQLAGGIRSGMSYCGAHTIEELRLNAEFVRITDAGVRESNVHDIIPDM